MQLLRVALVQLSWLGSRAAATEVIVADLEPRTLEHWRELFPLLRQRMPATYGRLSQGSVS